MLMSTQLYDLIVQEPSMTKNSSSKNWPSRQLEEREKCPPLHRRDNPAESKPVSVANWNVHELRR